MRKYKIINHMTNNFNSRKKFYNNKIYYLNKNS